MYNFVLTLHSYIRWIVLLAGIVASIRAIVGWLNELDWTDVDRRLGLILMIGMDIQILLGLILYIFLSPITTTAFADFGAAMADAETRFFVADHVFLMVVAFVLVHVGRAVSKRAANATQKHKRAAIFFVIVVSAILMATPWARPLLRF